MEKLKDISIRVEGTITNPEVVVVANERYEGQKHPQMKLEYLKFNKSVFYIDTDVVKESLKAYIEILRNSDVSEAKHNWFISNYVNKILEEIQEEINMIHKEEQVYDICIEREFKRGDKNEKQ